VTVFGVFRGLFCFSVELSVFWRGRGLVFLGSIRKQGYYESSILILLQRRVRLSQRRVWCLLCQ